MTNSRSATLLAVLASALVACEAGYPASSVECDEEPCLDPPPEGFQLRSSGITIAPGEDVEYCEVAILPGDPGQRHVVDGFEATMTPGSHHLIVAAVTPGSDTDRAATVGARVTCFGPTGFGGDVIAVTGQQQPYREERFPPGVGRIYAGGQKVIFNYHYFNPTEAPIEARVAVNFHVTAEENVQHLASIFARLHPDIDIPAHSDVSYPVECRMTEDVMVHSLTRHTHRWGKEFPVDFLGGPRDGEHIYTSPNYEDADHMFAEPVLVRAGDGFRFTCNYTNDTDLALRFGEKTTDEMCILFGVVFPVAGRELPAGTDCE